MPNLEFFLQCLSLKDLARTGWKLRQVKHPETVAAHSWGVSLLVLQHAQKSDLNENKCLSLAIVHDLIEVYTGDIPTHKVFLAKKGALRKKILGEKKALQKLAGLIQDKSFQKKFKQLSLDYIEKHSKEAKFVSDLEKVEMCMQALYYTKNKRTRANLMEFFETSYSRLYTEQGRDLLDQVLFEFLELNLKKRA